MGLHLPGCVTAGGTSHGSLGQPLTCKKKRLTQAVRQAKACAALSTASQRTCTLARMRTFIVLLVERFRWRDKVLVPLIVSARGKLSRPECENVRCALSRACCFMPAHMHCAKAH